MGNGVGEGERADAAALAGEEPRQAVIHCCASGSRTYHVVARKLPQSAVICFKPRQTLHSKVLRIEKSHVIHYVLCQ